MDEPVLSCKDVFYEEWHLYTNTKTIIHAYRKWNAEKIGYLWWFSNCDSHDWSAVSERIVKTKLVSKQLVWDHGILTWMGLTSP